MSVIHRIKIFVFLQSLPQALPFLRNSPVTQFSDHLQTFSAALLKEMGIHLHNHSPVQRLSSRPDILPLRNLSLFLHQDLLQHLVCTHISIPCTKKGKKRSLSSHCLFLFTKFNYFFFPSSSAKCGIHFISNTLLYCLGFF